MRSESIGSTSASFVDTLLTLQTLKSTFAGIVTGDGDYGIANNALIVSADLSRTSERCWETEMNQMYQLPGNQTHRFHLC